jgi:hypothetical protein
MHRIIFGYFSNGTVLHICSFSFWFCMGVYLYVVQMSDWAYLFHPSTGFVNTVYYI